MLKRKIFSKKLIFALILCSFLFILLQVCDFSRSESLDVNVAVPKIAFQTPFPNSIDELPSVNDSTLKWIYIITPTYKRCEQLPELIRLSHTLLLVKKVYWIVVDDADVDNELVKNYLQSIRNNLPNTYLLAPMPKKFQSRKVKPRGVSNRLRGLEWIRENAHSNGVFYFADDDNTYDLSLFSEIRKTEFISMFPVGLVTSYGISTPVLKNGVFVDFYDGWKANRKYPVDMAGFAVSVPFYLKTNASMPFKPGYEEDIFLQNLKFDISQVQFLGNNCTKILAWHTQTKKNQPANKTMITRYPNSNLNILSTIII